jgi:RNA polymerase sigma-70 factor, ECF subfamily
MTLDPALVDAAREATLQFRRRFEALRPELFRFCRHLTRSPWDAEDLVQDTLARTFAVLASQFGQEIEQPRTWLFRVASNLWIDRVRRARDVLGLPLDELSGDVTPDPRAAREAAGTLIARLSPQERVAVVLKDAFELSLDEIAAMLGTTPNAVKAALHRGRGKLGAGDPDPVHALEPEPARVPRAAALDAFCAAFNAGDLAAVKAVLLETALIELPGVAIDLGVAASSRPASGILYHSLRSPLSDGVSPRFLADYLPRPPRAELRRHRGEDVALLWYAHTTGEAVRCIVRFAVDANSGAIVHVREYFYSPDALAELCDELAVPWRSNGYGPG